MYAPFEIIAVPGTYVYGIDLEYEPTAPNDSIIRISSSEVILDLNNRSLKQADGNTQPGLAGVLIDSNLSQVTIKNGLIAGLTGKGIIVSSGCTDIVLDSIITDSCNLRGISVEGTTLSPIQDIEICNCEVENCCRGATGDYGLLLQNCSLFNVVNTKIELCAGSTSVIGFDLSNVTSSIFQSCVSNNNAASSTSATCIGYDLSSTSSALIFEDCDSFVNVAQATGSTVFGYRVASGVNDCSFTGCRVVNHIAASSVTGFSFTSNARNSLFECIASRNSCVAGTTTGILFSTCTGNKIFTCRINDNTSVTGTTRGVDFSSCTECFMQDCIISRNTGVNAASSFGARITPAAPTGSNVVTKTIAMRNGTTAGNQLTGFSGTMMNSNATDDVNTLQAWTNPALT
jgi:hypothetical protein